MFRLRFVLVLPTPSSAPSGGGGEKHLATHTVAQDYILLSFISFFMNLTLFFLCCAFSARDFPPSPSRDCRVCLLSISCKFSPFFVSFPAMLAVRGKVLRLVSYTIAPEFSFNRLSSSLLPRRASGPREDFDGGWP